MNENKLHNDLHGKDDFTTPSFTTNLGVASLTTSRLTSFIRSENSNKNRNFPISRNSNQSIKQSKQLKNEENQMQQHQSVRVACTVHQNHIKNDKNFAFLYKSNTSKVVVGVSNDEDSYDADEESTDKVYKQKEHNEDNQDNIEIEGNHFSDNNEGRYNKISSGYANSGIISMVDNKEKLSEVCVLSENTNKSISNSKYKHSSNKISTQKSKKFDIDLSKAMLEYAIAAGYVADIKINYDDWAEVRQAVVLMLDSYKPPLENLSALAASSSIPPKRPLSSYNVYFHLERRRLLLEQQLKLQNLQKQEGSSGDVEDISRVPADVLIKSRPPHADYTVFDIIAVNRSQVKNFDIPISLSDASKHIQESTSCKFSTTSTTIITSTKTGIKRKHCKTHGMIGFAQLARAVAWRWKNEMSRAQQCVFHGYFNVELDRYKKRHVAWMKQHQTLYLKIQEQQMKLEYVIKTFSDRTMVSKVAQPVGKDVHTCGNSYSVTDADTYRNDYGCSDVDTDFVADFDANSHSCNYSCRHTSGQPGSHAYGDISCKKVKLMSKSSYWNGSKETKFGIAALATPASASDHLNTQTRAVQLSQTKTDLNETSFSSIREPTKSTSQNLAKLSHIPFNQYPKNNSSTITNNSFNQECKESEGLKYGQNYPVLSMSKMIPATIDHSINCFDNNESVSNEPIPNMMNDREMSMMRMMKVMNDKDRSLDFKDDSVLDLPCHWQQYQQRQEQQKYYQKQLSQKLSRTPWLNEIDSSISYWQTGKPQQGPLSSQSRTSTAEYHPPLPLKQQQQLQMQPQVNKKVEDEFLLSLSCSSNIKNMYCPQVYIREHDSYHTNCHKTDTIYNQSSYMEPIIPFHFDQHLQQQQQQNQNQQEKHTIFKSRYQQQSFQLQQHQLQQQQQQEEQYFQDKLFKVSNHGTDTEVFESHTTDAANGHLAPLSIEVRSSLSSSKCSSNLNGDTVGMTKQVCLNNYQALPQQLHQGEMPHQRDCFSVDKNNFESQTTLLTAFYDVNISKMASDQYLPLFQQDETNGFSLGVQQCSFQIPLTNPTSIKMEEELNSLPTKKLAKDIADEAFHSICSSLLSPTPRCHNENKVIAKRNLQTPLTYMEKSNPHCDPNLLTNDVVVDHHSVGTKSVTLKSQSVRPPTKIRTMHSAPTVSKTQESNITHRRTTIDHGIATGLTYSKKQQLDHLKRMMSIQQKNMSEQQKRMEQLMKITVNLDSDFILIDNDECSVDDSCFDCDVNHVNENNASFSPLGAPTNDARHFGKSSLAEYQNDELLSTFLMKKNSTQESWNMIRNNQCQSLYASFGRLDTDNDYEGKRSMCDSLLVDDTDLDSLNSSDSVSDTFST